MNKRQKRWMFWSYQAWMIGMMLVFSGNDEQVRAFGALMALFGGAASLGSVLALHDRRIKRAFRRTRRLVSL